MIGIDNAPNAVRAGRVLRSGKPEEWRSDWDSHDDLVIALIESFEEEGVIGKTTVRSFRSNLAEIAILNDNFGWSVAWDERFFDHIVGQVKMLSLASEEHVRLSLTKRLLNYVGEGHIFSDPFYALSLAKAAEPLHFHNPTVSISEVFYFQLRDCYRLMRTFVLLHELGHAAIRNPQEQEIMSKNLKVVIDALKRAKNDEIDREIEQRYWRGHGSSDDFITQVLSQCEAGTVSKEMQVDLFAVYWLLMSEIGLFEGENEKPPDSSMAWALKMVYEAIMLLYFIMATMNGAKEWLRPKSIVQQFEMKDFPSVGALTARADVRGRLWAIFVSEHFAHDPGRLSLLHKDAGFRERYLSTQHQAYSRLLNGFDRNRVLKEANELRSKIGYRDARDQAAEEYGYSSANRSYHFG